MRCYFVFLKSLKHGDAASSKPVRKITNCFSNFFQLLVLKRVLLSERERRYREEITLHFNCLPLWTWRVTGHNDRQVHSSHIRPPRYISHADRYDSFVTLATISTDLRPRAVCIDLVKFQNYLSFISNLALTRAIPTDLDAFCMHGQFELNKPMS